MDAYKAQSEFLKALSHPARLAILDVLRDGEQCVCHIEALLSLRQAYISQQLMILKEAGLVEARRDGLNLYYRVVNPGTFNLLDTLNAATGFVNQRPKHKRSEAVCPCPRCNPRSSPELEQVIAAG